MDSKKNSDANRLLLRLCSKLTGSQESGALNQYEYALRVISSTPSSSDEDEFRIMEQWKNQLARRGRERDGAQLTDLHRRLQAQMLLRNRSTILKMLHKLAKFDEKDSQKGKVSGAAIFSQGLPSHLMSTPYSTAGGHGDLAQPRRPPGSHGELSVSRVSSAHTHGSHHSSGISSIRGRDDRSSDPTPTVPQAFMPSHMQAGHTLDSVTSRMRTVSIFGRQRENEGKPRVASAPPAAAALVHQGDNTSYELSELSLIKDLVFVLQGIDGRWISFDRVKLQHKLDPEVGVSRGQRQELLKLAECGWLYSKIKGYVDHHSSDKAFGLVGQSFCAALHQELTEYLRLIAVLEAQLGQDSDPGLGDPPCLSLPRLHVWLTQPLKQLKWLGALVDICKGKKGGSLASAIFSYTQHGDSAVKSLVTHVLTFVCQPVYATLLRWMYDGELDDTYHEFFVASDPTVKNDQLWHDKYSLRKSMIPSFLTMEQASKVLLTGKSINFLRQVCEDRTPTRGRDLTLNLDLDQAPSMFQQQASGVFPSMLDQLYQATSLRLLQVLQDQFMFLDHLKAMRRYLLLGQGDFIRHLMDLLEQDLAKPASNLYLHNLTGILETAIRATNAQYDDTDILRRLDVRLLDVSPGDTGWDVFSLEYRVDGPIRTVFTPECKIMYLRVFNFMWRAKRMEYVLAHIWKSQMASRRTLQVVPELWSVLHQCHTISSAMVHFIKQVQYYINFEVLECAWDDLLTKVDEAKDLDCIIAAHQMFLDCILGRCLLDGKSTEILQLLRTVFDLIIQFETAQGIFYEAANEEVQTRMHWERQREERASQGEWELTEEMEREEKNRRVSFIRAIIPSTRAKLQVLSTAYGDTVDQFLHRVASHPDASLRFLCFRLDFNEHYKIKDLNLGYWFESTPMKQRKSTRRDKAGARLCSSRVRNHTGFFS